MNDRSLTDADRPPPPRTDQTSAGSNARLAPLEAGPLSLETIDSRSVEDPFTMVTV